VILSRKNSSKKKLKDTKAKLGEFTANAKVKLDKAIVDEKKQYRLGCLIAIVVIVILLLIL